uniref:ER membrane protein complex subunit 10 n=1 Tax=Kalanchoe fedtschenkoi TaxID=63787 RepID=A0A7N0U3F5_KALFE
MAIKLESLTNPTIRNAVLLLLFLLVNLQLLLNSSAFQSDELLLDEDEFEGIKTPTSNPDPTPTRSAPAATRKRSSDSDSDSKIQFALEHAFGESDFSAAGVFSARLKTWGTGGQTLTKLRFSRNSLSDTEKESFDKLLESDDFYKIRLPSNVLSPPGREYVIASVKARCLPREALDEHFVIHMDGINILSVNYGSPGSCQYPRQLKRPSRWSFNSYTLLKSSEQAPRAPAFAEEIFGAEVGEGDIVPSPEKSFWAKYWMYIIPLGLVVMNAFTQAMNLPEEGAPGQPGAVQRTAAPAAPRRR